MHVLLWCDAYNLCTYLYVVALTIMDLHVCSFDGWIQDDLTKAYKRTVDVSRKIDDYRQYPQFSLLASSLVNSRVMECLKSSKARNLMLLFLLRYPCCMIMYNVSLLQYPHTMMHIILVVFAIFLNIDEIIHWRALGTCIRLSKNSDSSNSSSLIVIGLA